MSRKVSAQKLSKFRELMKTTTTTRAAGIQAYVLPYGDAHQSEYLAPQDKRIEYISGFTGSAGTIVITQDKALLWTNHRYICQAEKELNPPDVWIVMKACLPETPDIATWLIDNLPVDASVGADSTFMSHFHWISMEKKLYEAGLFLEALDDNLVDEVWNNKPLTNMNPVVPRSLEFTGQKSVDKINKCFEEMEKNQVDILVITKLDEVAYLLNWWGSDIPYNPVFFAFVIFVAKEVHIFIDYGRLLEEAKIQLRNEGVEAFLHKYDNFRQFLSQVSQNEKFQNVWICQHSNHATFIDTSSLNKITRNTPVSLMKMVKNEREIEGVKKAHLKDALGIVKYFAWLENKVKLGKVVTEISATAQLEKFKQEQDHYMGPSFPTVSAFGPNAAILHYEPKPETDLPITRERFYLCNTGSQFWEGTTFVARTWHFGTPTDFESECYTRLIKGQCNLASATFPSFISSNLLDTVVRLHLWKVGLDFTYTTDHDKKSYLCAHESPTYISRRPYFNDAGLQPGMFLSNELGYYEEENFGIRMDNVKLVVKANTKYLRSNKQYLTFKTVTIVPIQTRHILSSLLTDEELEFLNKYNERCLRVLKPYFVGPENERTLKWLQKETEPIKREELTDL